MLDLPIAKLIRTAGNGQTDGILYFGNQQINTIEPFPAVTPEGDYVCKYALMVSHGVWHYELQNVPGHCGIFIHKGTKVTDSLGCIVSDPISIGCLETWLPNHGDFLLKIRS